MGKDETDASADPLDETILQRLAHRRYDALFADREKAKIRLDNDRDGAVTAARTPIETTAKVILDEMGVPYQETWDLPKLYHEAASSLGILAKTPLRSIIQSGLRCL